MSIPTIEYINEMLKSNVNTIEESPQQLLEKAVYELPNIDGAFLFDPEGATFACAGSEAANEASIQALVNGLIQLADRTTGDLGRGALVHMALQGQLGFVVATILDSGYTLVLLGSSDARLGLLLHDLEWLGAKLSPLLI
jgi:predicted regulator of Ras-like GTPase activity (Roadblock/LC7/MglB family)